MSTPTQTAVSTPQETGAHALALAVEFARKGAIYAASGGRTAEENANTIAVYCGLAGTYADIAKAAAALAAAPAAGHVQ
ncbi:hypothetical protein [Streptomyces sp. NPDC008125]|uniref:hypothetical protein n=1 Tax=Streptomyces sp. NPDC008125 TaxID=3364811 RepID=UPI0036E21EBE